MTTSLLGNLKPAHEIYAVFQKRVEDRVAKIKEMVKQPMDFKIRRHRPCQPAKSALAKRRSRGGRRSGGARLQTNCSRKN